MIFFVVMPLVVGLMTFAVPLQSGVCDVAFPVLNSVSSWLTAAGALLVNVSLVVGNFAPHRVDGLSTAVRARVFP
jgi:cytochrome o ubiquinol oxidase subunit I